MSRGSNKNDAVRQRQEFWQTVLSRDSSMGVEAREGRMTSSALMLSGARNGRRRTTLSSGMRAQPPAGGTLNSAGSEAVEGLGAEELSLSSAWIGRGSRYQNRMSIGMSSSATGQGGFSSGNLLREGSFEAGTSREGRLQSEQARRPVDALLPNRKDAPCPHCQAHFKRKYDLLQHISAVHEKNRPFRCDVCDAAFAHKGTLSKHIRTVHRRERPYSCEHCGQRFSERGNVNKHKQRSNACRYAEVNRQSAAGGREGSGNTEMGSSDSGTFGETWGSFANALGRQ